MCTVHIVCGAFKPQGIGEDDVIFWWDTQNCNVGEYSVPSWYKEHSLSLREELVDFVYDLGLSTVQGKPLYEWFCAGDRLSMWWCSVLFEKHPMLMPEVYEILKLRCIEQMLAQFAPQCTQIILHGDDVKLQQSLMQFCKGNALSFTCESKSITHQFNKIKLSIKYKVKVVLNVFCGLSRLVYWLFTVRIFTPYTKAVRPPTPCVSMVSYFPHVDGLQAEEGRFISPYWRPLQEKLLSAQKNINWLFMRINSSHLSFRQAVAKVREFNKTKLDGVSFHFAEEFLAFGDIWQAFTRYLRLCYRSYKLESHVRPLCCLGNMNIWVYLGPYYAKSFQGWICLERCLQRKAMFNYVAFVGVQEWTLFPLENCPWERMLTEAIRYANAGQVYGAQHSVIRHADFRYFDSPKLFSFHKTQEFLPHKILVNGKQAYNTLLKAKVPAHKLVVIEALRYLHLLKYNSVIQQQSPRQNVLVVVTSFFPRAVDAHMALLAKWLNEKAGQNWQVYIKEHPHCAVKSFVQKYMPNQQYIDFTTKNMDEVLADARNKGAVVWAANDTSVVVEALYAHLPLLVQNEGDGIDLCPVQGLDGLKYVYTCEDVHRALTIRQVLCPNQAIMEQDFFALDVDLSKWRALLGF